MLDVTIEREGGLIARPRRLRRTPALRRLVAEHVLDARQLAHPLFIRDGSSVRRPIPSLPGHAQLSVDHLPREIDEAIALGLRTFLLF